MRNCCASMENEDHLPHCPKDFSDLPGIAEEEFREKIKKVHGTSRSNYALPQAVYLRSFDGGTAVSEDDVRVYVDVIQKAFAVYKDRDDIRRGLWKESNAAGQRFQITVKADRIRRSLEQIDSASVEVDRQALADNAVEELLDIINYSVFAIRHLRGDL